MAALLFTLITLSRWTPSQRHITYFLFFSIGVLLSQFFSLDPTQSLYWSIQYLVYACLWLILPSATVKIDLHELWSTLTSLGLTTALVTTYQWATHKPLVGLLPVNPNFNAVWMAAIAVALFAKPLARPPEIGVMIYLSTLVIIGHSRSGLLALIVGSFYAMSHRYPWRNVVYSFLLIAIGVFLIPDAWVWNRLRLVVFEEGGRLRIWGVACRSLLDYPLTGYGPGNFELAYHRYAFALDQVVRYARSTSFAHNDYLQAFCELGWPTAGLLVVGLGDFFRPNAAAAKRPFFVPAKAILLALCAAACFNPIFKMPALAYLALLASAYLLPPSVEEPLASFRRTFFKTGANVATITALLLTAWCGMRTYWSMHQQWDHIITWNPKDAEAWHELANQTTDPQKAIVYHQRAVKCGPEEIYYVEGLAMSLEALPGKGHIAEALDAYRQAIRVAPKRATNYLAVARLLWREKEFTAAEEWSQKASALEPNYWECDLWRARCAASLQDTSRAIFLLKHLSVRRQRFVIAHPEMNLSPYEQAILRYDEDVVRREITFLERSRVPSRKLSAISAIMYNERRYA